MVFTRYLGFSRGTFTLKWFCSGIPRAFKWYLRFSILCQRLFKKYVWFPSGTCGFQRYTCIFSTGTFIFPKVPIYFSRSFRSCFQEDVIEPLPHFANPFINRPWQTRLFLLPDEAQQPLPHQD